MPRAELHCHLAGCLSAEDTLDLIGRRAIDWTPYEDAFYLAYDRYPPLREILSRLRLGDQEARAEFHDLFTFGDEDAGNFDRFSAKFALLGCALLGGRALRGNRLFTAELAAELDLCVAAIAARARREEIHWTEVRARFAGHDPQLTRQIYRHLLAALARHQDRHHALRLAISLPRSDNEDFWHLVEELALGENGEYLVAVDFCHVEEGHPPRLVAPFAERLAAFNRQHPRRALALLYHVGESYRDKSLESALRWVDEAIAMGAHRLGHALALGVDPDHESTPRHELVCERLDQIAWDLAQAEELEAYGVRIDRPALEREARSIADYDPLHRLTISYDAARLAEVRARQDLVLARCRQAGCVIESCPTSNRRIGGLAADHHPLPRFLDAGAPVVIGSDDPGLLGVNLADEIRWAAERCGCSAAEWDAAAWQARSPLLCGREHAD